MKKDYSIIIPTLEEEQNIKGCIESIRENGVNDAEIILVDASSKDNTVVSAQRAGAHIDIKVLVTKRQGLANQLNMGAQHAKGDILLFLHADCRLPSDALKKIAGFYDRYGDKAVGGAFTMTLDGKRFFYKLFSLCGSIYSYITDTYFGDRAIFIKKSYFYSIGGYRDIPIMSDVDFSRKMKKAGKVAQLTGPVVSDSRKFDREPFWKMVYLILFALIAFRIGVDPGIIKKKYYQGTG